MKTFLVVLTLVVAALAAPRQYEPLWQDYHEEFGIEQAARIKAAEDAMDFDGSRIAGGENSQRGQFPFMVGLLITLTSGFTSVCGSSLVSNTRALTAAHCWRHGWNQGRYLTVVIDSVRLFSGGLRINTNQVTMHAGYNQNNFNNDIAMINIPHVPYTGTINRIVLATGSNLFVGHYATAVGFGRINDNVAIGKNQVLSHVRVPVMSNQACEHIYGRHVVIHSVICTSGHAGRNTCPGDSGGPLHLNSQLIGVISFGARVGCTQGYPAGHMRVTSFVHWIYARL